VLFVQIFPNGAIWGDGINYLVKGGFAAEGLGTKKEAQIRLNSVLSFPRGLAKEIKSTPANARQANQARLRRPDLSRK
jgi:hypothetical protein